MNFILEMNEEEGRKMMGKGEGGEKEEGKRPKLIKSSPLGTHDFPQTWDYFETITVYKHLTLV